MEELLKEFGVNSISEMKKLISDNEEKIKALNSVKIINKSIFDKNKNPLILYDCIRDSILFVNNEAGVYYSTNAALLLKAKLNDIDPFLAKEIDKIKESYLTQKINIVYERYITKIGAQKLVEASLSPIMLGNRNLTLIEILNLEPWEFTKESLKSEINEEFDKIKDLLEVETDKRKLAENKLNLLASKINLITNLKDSFFYTLRVISNSRFQLIETSKAFKKLTGYELRDVEDLGGWTAIISQADVHLFQTLRLKLKPNEISWGEYRIVDKNGEYIWIRDYLLPQFEETGRFIQHIYGFAEDITRFKKMEESLERLKDEELKKSNNFDLSNLKTNVSNKIDLMEALESFQKVVFSIFPYQIYHDSGVIVDANNDFQDITSIIINPLTKKTLFEIFDSEKRSEYLKIIQQCKTDIFEIRIKDKMGTTIKFSAVNIQTEYKGKMIKLLAMKDPVFY